MQEYRRLVFSEAELEAIIRDWYDGDEGGAIERVAFAGGDEVEAELSMNAGSGRENQTFASADIVLAIIEYCSGKRIPIAQGAEKTLSRSKGGIAFDMKIGTAQVGDSPAKILNSGTMERRAYIPGDRIFREGEKGTEAYLVESGLIEISKGVGGDEVVVLCTVESGGIVGAGVLVNEGVHSVTARVSKQTSIRVIADEDYQKARDRGDTKFVTLLETAHDDIKQLIVLKGSPRIIVR